MAKSVIALDVGGTSIKSALVEAGGVIAESSVKSFTSMAKESKETIISNFLQIIRQQAEPKQETRSISGIAMAFPGPFDYEQGISLLRGIDKYDSIYGLRLGLELRKRMEADAACLSSFKAGWRIVFVNDVTAFALGQLINGPASAYARCLCVTIGTGLGSAFLEHGTILTTRSDLPENGWLYSQPFLEGIMDDYISRRGILRLAQEFGFEFKELDVKEIADLARQGNPQAVKVFDCFGSRLASALEPWMKSFRPDALIIGGQIAKSYDLFKEAFQRENTYHPAVLPVVNTSYSAFRGAASLV